MVQNDKKFCLSCSISQELYIIWFSFTVHMCKMIISLGFSFSFFFFSFFKILIFQVVRGVKGQKLVQNNKKFCLSHSISQESYIMRLSFMVHICKMIISSGFFFIFSKFWFSGSIGGYKDNRQSRMTKNSVCRALYLRNPTSYDCSLWHTCVRG